MTATGRILPLGSCVYVPVEDLLDDVRSGKTEPFAWTEALRFANHRKITIGRMGIGEIVKILYDLELRERALVVYKYKVTAPSREELEMNYPAGVF